MGLNESVPVRMGRKQNGAEGKRTGSLINPALLVSGLLVLSTLCRFVGILVYSRNCVFFFSFVLDLHPRGTFGNCGKTGILLICALGQFCARSSPRCELIALNIALHASNDHVHTFHEWAGPSCSVGPEAPYPVP